MPFTPLHLGPGLALKALGGPRLSFTAFALAQVAIDLEPLIGLMRGADVLHGASHTWLAGVLIAPPVAALAYPVERLWVRRWNRELAALDLERFAIRTYSSRSALLLGACAGTLSHLLLDAPLYLDMHPLAPWSPDNALLGAVSQRVVEWVCLSAGFAGLLGLSVRVWRSDHSDVGR